MKKRLHLTLLTEQIRQGLSASEFATPSELTRAESLIHQRRKIAYLSISHASHKADIKPSDQDIEEHYNAHENEFNSPEQVKVAYLELSIDELANQVPSDATVLQSHYEEHAANYTVAEQRSAKHILVKIPEDADATQTEEAEAKARTYYHLTQQGKSLDDIAKQDFTEGETQSEFGALGFFQKGVMQPEFDEAVFALQKGATSEPVRTRFGFHIIYLEDIKSASTRSFEEARAEVELAYKREQAETQFFDYADQLANLSFENPNSLDAASETLDLPIQTSEYFSRSGSSGLTAEAKVIAAAFSSPVLTEGMNSEALELDETRLVVLRVSDHQEATLKPIDEVRDTIVETLG